MVQLHSRAQRRTQRNLRHLRKIRLRIETLKALLDLDKNMEMDKIVRNTKLAIQLLLIESDDAFATLFRNGEGTG